MRTHQLSPADTHVFPIITETWTPTGPGWPLVWTPAANCAAHVIRIEWTATVILAGEHPQIRLYDAAARTHKITECTLAQDPLSTCRIHTSTGIRSEHYDDVSGTILFPLPDVIYVMPDEILEITQYNLAGFDLLELPTITYTRETYA